jgi:hypothetical protein
MPKRVEIDFTKPYDRLHILEELPPRQQLGGRWVRRVLCRCICSVEKEVDLEPLLRGLVRSCGCLATDQRRARAEQHYLLEEALPTRFWNKVDKNGPVPPHRPDLGPCWVWTGAKVDGYGVWWKNKHNKQAHISVYEDLHGPVPEGLQLDHLCRVRHCCRPMHLEPVTCRMNLLRGETLAATNAKKTHCPKGHALDAANTYMHRGKRACKRCRAARRHAHRTTSRAGWV